MSIETTIQNEIVKLVRKGSSDIQVSDGDVSFRHFGTWEVPADEEDDGDYDWEVPTLLTLTQVDNICIALKVLFPSHDFRYSIHEKNWITIDYDLKS